LISFTQKTSLGAECGSTDGSIAGTRLRVSRDRDTDPHSEYRTIWSRKSILRSIYRDYYRRIAAHCIPGTTVELGGGIGQLKSFMPDAILSDIQKSPMIDVVADAQRMPFRTGAVSNIVMLDVLHHIEFPALFFEEALRVLRPGGRCVMIEPAITLGSGLFYRLLHAEPVFMSADPLAKGAPDPNKPPYDSNQAIPTLLATRDRERFVDQFPGFSYRSVEWFSFLAYPLSGGFKRWTLLPAGLGQRLLEWEERFERRFGRMFGFRVMIVLEKS
jgi:SAM-dependent methyltransferase